MSHRRNRNRQRRRQPEPTDLAGKIAASPWVVRRARDLSTMIRVNTRALLAFACGLLVFEAIDPWTTNAYDRALPLLAGFGFGIAAVLHRRYLR
jgi:hypothetical protein